jgi:hypothetical protein
MFRCSERIHGKINKSQIILKSIEKIRYENNVKKQLELNIGLYEFLQNINEIKVDYIAWMTEKNIYPESFDVKFMKILIQFKKIGYYYAYYYDEIIPIYSLKCKTLQNKFKRVYDNYCDCFYSYVKEQINQICPSISLNEDMIGEIYRFL